MSDRSYRRTNSASSRASSKLPQLYPASTHRRKALSSLRRSSKSSKHVEVMRRSSSEPSLRSATISFITGEDNRTINTPERVLYRPQTCADVHSSPLDCLLPQSPQKLQNYNREAKVVVNVMVEGSPGPVKVLLKLGSSVEEAIKLVVNKYLEEWRSPLLDKNAASTFELHQSYFSLQCLERSTLIGDLGGRSFYLRKGNSSRGGVEEVQSSQELATQLPLIFFSGFILMNIHKIIRRTRKLWTFLGCISCDGWWHWHQIVSYNCTRFKICIYNSSNFILMANHCSIQCVNYLPFGCHWDLRCGFLSQII